MSNSSMLVRIKSMLLLCTCWASMIASAFAAPLLKIRVRLLPAFWRQDPGWLVADHGCRRSRLAFGIRWNPFPILATLTNVQHRRSGRFALRMLKLRALERRARWPTLQRRTLRMKGRVKHLSGGRRERLLGVAMDVQWLARLGRVAVYNSHLKRKTSEG